MALNLDCIGKRYPDTPGYEVGREKVREFVEATGATHPHSVDIEAARSAGYRDLVAPPTFAVVIAQPATKQASFDPEVGVDYSRVVHGEQRFVHHEPICAGDVVTARVTITDVRPAGTNWRLTTQTTLHRLADDALLCTATSSLIERGEG